MLLMVQGPHLGPMKLVGLLRGLPVCCTRKWSQAPSTHAPDDNFVPLSGFSDALQPMQAFYFSGRARDQSAIVQALAQVKEAGIYPDQAL